MAVLHSVQFRRRFHPVDMENAVMGAAWIGDGVAFGRTGLSAAIVSFDTRKFACRSPKLAAFDAQIGPLDRFDRLRRSHLTLRSRGPIP